MDTLPDVRVLLIGAMPVQHVLLYNTHCTDTQHAMQHDDIPSAYDDCRCHTAPGEMAFGPQAIVIDKLVGQQGPQ